MKNFLIITLMILLNTGCVNHSEPVPVSSNINQPGHVILTPEILDSLPDNELFTSVFLNLNEKLPEDYRTARRKVLVNPMREIR